jgi:deoxyribodipyrimidine photo-lyase
VADAVDTVTSSLGVSGVLSTADDWGALLVEWATKNHLSTIATAYAPVGPVAELLANASKQLDRYGIALVQLRRPYDNIVWPHTQRGYFKLKEQIPVLLERLEITNGSEETVNAAV